MVIHVADQSGSDTELDVKMLKSFAPQDKELWFGNCVFDAIVMRMLHHVDNTLRVITLFLLDEW